MAEPTIADKLKTLKVQPSTEQNLTEEADNTFAPVPSTSLAQTLAQALHSSDNRLLDSCFIHGKEQIIKNSVKRLPSSLVLPLIDALVARLGRSNKAFAAPLEVSASLGETPCGGRCGPQETGSDPWPSFFCL